jgi:hypothetical protein
VASVITASAVLAAASAASAALVADHRFAGDLESSVLAPETFAWPSTPFATENVAGCRRQALPFAQGEGGAIHTQELFGSSGPYTIIVQFRFDEVDSYRRVINWSASFSVENGLYIRDGTLTFYDTNDPGGNNHQGATVISPGEYAESAITRDAGKEINTYVNGIHQVTYVDAANVAVSTHPAGNVYFFQDNDNGPGTYDEESGGAIARIRVYDEALPAAQITNTVACFGRRCGGSVVTIDATAGDDVLVGTQGRDVVDGLAGNDTIRGLGGKDVLCGNAGRDKLVGGKGRDRLLGGAGKDRVIGAKGRDTCRGGKGRDVRRGCERGRG